MGLIHLCFFAKYRYRIRQVAQGNLPPGSATKRANTVAENFFSRENTVHNEPSIPIGIAMATRGEMPFLPTVLEGIWTEVKDKTTPSEEIPSLSATAARRKFADIICPMATAVRVEGDYLNANFVSDDKTQTTLVAAQYPVDEALFWKFVSTEKFSIIDLSGAECSYAPPEGASRTYLDSTVKCCKKTSGELFDTYTYEVFRASKMTQIERYMVKGWPDHGVPSLENFHAVLTLLEQIAPNVFVHCMGGVGRTGMLITSYFLHEEIKKNLISSNTLRPRFVELLVSLRKQRDPKFVQTQSQSELILTSACEKLNKKQ